MSGSNPNLDTLTKVTAFLKTHWPEIAVMMPKNLLKDLNQLAAQVSKPSTADSASIDLYPFIAPLDVFANHCRKLALEAGIDDANEMTDLFTQIFQKGLQKNSPEDANTNNFVLNLLNSLFQVSGYNFSQDKRFNHFTEAYENIHSKQCAHLINPITGIMRVLMPDTATIQKELPQMDALLLNYLEDFQYGKIAPFFTTTLKTAIPENIATNITKVIREHDSFINSMKTLSKSETNNSSFLPPPAASQALLQLGKLKTSLANSIAEIETHASQHGHPSPFFTADLIKLKSALNLPPLQKTAQLKK